MLSNLDVTFDYKYNRPFGGSPNSYPVSCYVNGQRHTVHYSGLRTVFLVGEVVVKSALTKVPCDCGYSEFKLTGSSRRKRQRKEPCSICGIVQNKREWEKLTEVSRTPDRGHFPVTISRDKNFEWIAVQRIRGRLAYLSDVPIYLDQRDTVRKLARRYRLVDVASNGSNWLATRKGPFIIDLGV